MRSCLFQHRVRLGAPGIAAFAALAAFFQSVPASALTPYRCLAPIVAKAHEADRARRAARESAIELELKVDDAVLAMLTTDDGTLAPLLREGVKPPRKLVSWLAARGLKPADAPRVAWDSLPPELQRLAVIASSKGVNFYKAGKRRIQGLRVRPRITVTFKSPGPGVREITYQGRSYPVGVPVTLESTGLMPHVEYTGETAVKRFNGIELHLRSGFSAGTNASDAWALADALGAPRPPLHAHAVGRFPLAEMRADGDVQVARMVDYWLRANLLAMTRTIRRRVKGVGTKYVDGRLVFGTIQTPEVTDATNLLQRSFESGQFIAGDAFKNAWVSLHGSDKYDGPDPLWGFQYRSLPRYSDEAENRLILDAIQKGMHSGDYGIPRDRIAAWLKASTDRGDNILYATSGSWFDADYIGDLPPALSGKLGTEFFDDATRERFLQEADEGHRELKMLVHDWSLTPLLHGDAPANERMLAAQAKALRRWKAGEAGIADLMNDFLTDSGLEEAVAASFGLKPGDLPAGQSLPAAAPEGRD